MCFLKLSSDSFFGVSWIVCHYQTHLTSYKSFKYHETSSYFNRDISLDIKDLNVFFHSSVLQVFHLDVPNLILTF